MGIIEKVKELDLPLGEYVVVGSGVMEAVGIREAGDVDIAVTKKLFDEMKKSERWEIEEKYGKYFLKGNGVDVIRELNWNAYKTTTEEAIASSVKVSDIPFMNLTELKKFKNALGREKDRNDIKLIDEFLAKNREA